MTIVSGYAVFRCHGGCLLLERESQKKEGNYSFAVGV